MKQINRRRSRPVPFFLSYSQTWAMRGNDKNSSLHWTIAMTQNLLHISLKGNSPDLIYYGTENSIGFCIIDLDPFLMIFHEETNPIQQIIVDGTTFKIVWTILPSITLMFVYPSFALLN